MNGTGKLYRTQAFAQLAGVTVRTLHHYDRLGLLQPQQRTESGYRLYQETDLERLEQVMALKYLGFPLRQIRTLLQSEELPLSASLRLQRGLLEEKRRQLSRAIKAIRAAEAAGNRGRAPGTTLLKKIIEGIAKPNDSNHWTDQYYSAAARAKVRQRQPAFTEDMQIEVSRQWSELVSEVEAALGEDPAGLHVQTLAARWTKLMEGFTQGDPGVIAGLKKAWADRKHWPGEMKQKTAGFRPELLAFLERARTAKQSSG